MRRVPVFLVAAALLAPLAASAHRPAVSPAAVQELARRPDAPLLIDVRTPAEYAEARLDEIGRDRWVLVYCRSGKRASAAQSVLEEAGIEVRQVEGSWLRWQAEGRPVERPAAQESAR